MQDQSGTADAAQQKPAAVLTTAGFTPDTKQHLEALGQNIGEQLAKDLLVDLEGWATGVGWNTKEDLPNGLFKFQLKNPFGVTFNCEIGYQNGKFVFTGSPA